MKIGVNYLKHLIDSEGLDKTVKHVNIEDIDDEEVKLVYRNLLNSFKELEFRLLMKSDTKDNNTKMRVS